MNRAKAVTSQPNGVMGHLLGRGAVTPSLASSAWTPWRRANEKAPPNGGAGESPQTRRCMVLHVGSHGRSCAVRIGVKYPGANLERSHPGSVVPPTFPSTSAYSPAAMGCYPHVSLTPFMCPDLLGSRMASAISPIRSNTTQHRSHP